MNEEASAIGETGIAYCFSVCGGREIYIDNRQCGKARVNVILDRLCADIGVIEARIFGKLLGLLVNIGQVCVRK
jgi:hypothetical protein